MDTRSLKLFPLILALALMLSALAGCTSLASELVGSEPVSEPVDVPEITSPPSDTLVVAQSALAGKFSPFYCVAESDKDVVSLVHQTLLGYERGGSVVMRGIEGQTTAYNGTDYTYSGIADCTITKTEEGGADYSFTLRDGVKFSDGKPLTIDDVIFTMYVLCDPTYDGPSEFASLPIAGLLEYRSGMQTKGSLIIASGRENSESEYFTPAEHAQYWAAVDEAGIDFVNGIFEYCKDFGATNVGEAMIKWGYGDYISADDDAETCYKFLESYYEGDLEYMNSLDAANVDLFDAISEHLGDDAKIFSAGVQSGEGADSISGIIKTGNNSMTVSMSSFDPAAITQFVLPVAPMHYYGDEAQYDYEGSRFGFTKGDLSSVKAVTAAPVGAGAYKLSEFTEGVVKLEANENYWQGAPATQYIRFEEHLTDSDTLVSLTSGACDIGSPTFSDAIADVIRDRNSNNELSGDTLTTVSDDAGGYSYIAMSADRMSVGGEGGSEASKNLRGAFATVLAAYRSSAIGSYYGERACVIEYPVSNTSWAAPRPAEEGYKAAYTIDAEGKSIYTDLMTETERYAAALDAAVGYLKAAGYAFDETTGTFTSAPDGASLSYTVCIVGGGSGNHPSYGIVAAAKGALETIGITLNINDLTSASPMWEAVDAGELDMWVATRDESADPDMTAAFSGANALGRGGADTNGCCITDENLDSLLASALLSSDYAERKAIYKQCLDIVLDWACEVPTYQRYNAVIFSSSSIDVSTLPADMTSHYGWLDCACAVQMG